MSAYEISELQSKDAITAETSYTFIYSQDDERWLIEMYINLLPECNIKEKQLSNHHIVQMANAINSPGTLRDISDDQDYNKCVKNARSIKGSDKSPFCLNFYYVFYAELEINLNRFFTESSRERWSLLFTDYNFMPPKYNNDIHIDMHTSAQLFTVQNHILMILLNAKVKYCCLKCCYEWTTARGRVIFQAERPKINKHNVLFAYLFTQKCQKCRQETEPSWYLDEATRVMKTVCRILLDKFYSHPQFTLSSSSSSSSDNEEEYEQRSSDMRNHHHQDLCRACQEGSCYNPHRHFYKRR